MREVIGGVVINEQETEPLSDYAVDFLSKYRKESPIIDIKKIIPTDKDSDFPEIAKDIFAFSNYGGGWILVGWEEYPTKNQFTPVGLPNDYGLEQAVLQEKFNSYSEEPITLLYREFPKDFRPMYAKAREDVKSKVNSISDRFGIIYIPPYPKILVPKKEGAYDKSGKKRVVFSKGDIFYRRGTQSIKPPTSYELSLIKKRLEKENYRHSVLSGEPDIIEETLQSNLFEVINTPKFIYTAIMRNIKNNDIELILKSQDVFPDYYFNFKMWDGLLVTFEDISDRNSPYRSLINEQTIKKEPLQYWLSDYNKRNVFYELLKRAFIFYSIGKGLTYFEDKNKLYYSTIDNQRKKTWKSRYGTSSRTVAFKVNAIQVERQVYAHPAFAPDFIYIDNKIYLRINPTFVITDNGIVPISSFELGTIITRLIYDNYNNSYLNNILFWIYQLSQESDIQIGNYFTISYKPVQVKAPIGILFDIPSSEFELEETEEISSDELSIGEADDF